MAKKKPREIVITTDILTKADITRVKKDIREQALELARTHLMDWKGMDNFDSLYQELAQEVLRENRATLKKMIREAVAEDLKTASFDIEVDFK